MMDYRIKEVVGILLSTGLATTSWIDHVEQWLRMGASVGAIVVAVLTVRKMLKEKYKKRDE